MIIWIPDLIFPWPLVSSNILQSAPCTCFHGVPCIEPLLWWKISVLLSLKSGRLQISPVNNDNELCLLNLFLTLIRQLGTEVHEELIVGSILKKLLLGPLEQADHNLTPLHCLQPTLKLHILHPDKSFLVVSKDTITPPYYQSFLLSLSSLQSLTASSRALLRMRIVTLKCCAT